MKKTDVLIVGAGPSGLVLANVLAGYGVAFRVVDGKSGPVEQSRAALVHVRTLELLDRLGLAERAIARGVHTDRIEVYQRERPTAEFRLAGKKAEALTPFPFALGLEQDRTEQLLVEGLAEQGHGVDWDTAFVALTEGDGETRAVIRGPDGAEETISARWVVGADGAGSRVRHALGLGFAGTTYDQTGLLADVDIDLPAAAGPSPGTIRLNLTRGGFVGMLRLGSGHWRLFGALPPHLAARDTRSEVSHEAYARVSLEDLQQWFDAHFRLDTNLRHAQWTALFRIHSRIAERFAAGNVFLVGDAAHIHSPAGGQGMNLGIGDAFNLGWKLALVAKGWARERLLASYEAERYPVAETVLRSSDRGFVVEATPNPVVAWIRTHIAPYLIGPLLRRQAVQARIFRLFSQTWVSYRTGPAVSADRERDSGPRPGDRAPHGTFTAHRGDGARGIFDLMSATRHDLLLFEGPGPHPAPSAYRHTAEEILARYGMDTAVHVIPATEAELHRVYGATKPRFFLIRPDGHIACKGSPANPDGLAAYLDTLYTPAPNAQERQR